MGKCETAIQSGSRQHLPQPLELRLDSGIDFPAVLPDHDALTLDRLIGDHQCLFWQVRAGNNLVERGPQLGKCFGMYGEC